LKRHIGIHRNHSPLPCGAGALKRPRSVSKYKCSLLVVDDEPYILSTLTAFLNNEFEVLTADTAQAAQALFAQREIDLVLTDQKMPRLSGVQLLEWVRINHPRTVRLLMTGFAELEEAVEAINRGQVYRYLFKPWRADDLMETLKSAAHTFVVERAHEELLIELENRVAQRTRELEEANHELEQKNKMLEKLALTDPLTGLPNRRAIDRLAERELRRRDRYPSPLALGLIDVDHFKEINARYTLSGGDKVLVDLGKVLLSSLRTVDLMGRIGGEEFQVIAPETNTEGAVVLGERIRSTVEQAVFSYKEETILVRVSIGFAVAEDGQAADYEHMRHVAGAALAQAKVGGRNCCIAYQVNRPPFEQAG